jgi:hypothetical protein
MLTIPKTIDAARKLRDTVATQVAAAVVKGREAEMDIAQRVADGYALYVAFPALGKFDSWAQTLLGGVSVDSLDRYKRGGTVANVLAGNGVTLAKGQTHRALAPFYRFVAPKSDATPEDIAAGVTALLGAFEQAVKKAKGEAVTEKVALQVAGSKKKGTRGSAKGKTRNTPAADAGKGETEETVTVDPVADEQAAKVVAAFLKQCERKGLDIAAVRAIMSRTCAMAKEHTPERIALALSPKTN